MGSEEFKLLFEAKLDDILPVWKYRSVSTGLTLCVARVEGPIVKAALCLATECHDDDGLPHTLEHLVFMGSEKYPYKGVLDLLANRCLASGTNAWTDVDHTAYTMETAGAEGSCKLLPIYLDHILYPTLTESAYVTEVHHVNGSGEDAGVVYCEMQARNSHGDELAQRKIVTDLYPGRCGYKSYTGGDIKNLRDSTSNHKVHQYHQQYYRPENLCIIVVGQVDINELISSITPFMEKIKEKMSSSTDCPTYERPWQSLVENMEGSVERVVRFPSEDEDHGMVLIGWRGPKAEDLYEVSSIMILLEYLTDTPISALQKVFVEGETACCSKVSYSISENSSTCFYLDFENVKKDSTKTIKQKLFKVLNQILEAPDKFDMGRMNAVIHKKVLDCLNSIEDNPHDTVIYYVIGHFLYGNHQQDLVDRLNPHTFFERMKSETCSYWLNLLKKYLFDGNNVTIIGEASQELQLEMAEDEKGRIERQRNELDKRGLEEKQRILDNAKKHNEVSPPIKVLNSVAVPSTECVSWHPIQPSNNHYTSRTHANVKQEHFPLQNIPFPFQLDNIHSNFIEVHAQIDTSTLEQELRPYLSLFVEVIQESPVFKDGVLLSHEEVVKQLERDTLFHFCSVGHGGDRFKPGEFSNLITLTVKGEVSKYKECCHWLKHLLFNSRFTSARVSSVAKKMSTAVAKMKRNGNKICHLLMRDILFGKGSNHYACSMLRQHKFLTGLVKKLSREPKDILDNLEKLRSSILTSSSICVHLSCDVERVNRLIGEGARQFWENDFLPSDDITSNVDIKEFRIMKDESLLKQDLWSPAVKTEGGGEGIKLPNTVQSLLVGVGSVESGFMLQTSPGPSSHLHADYASTLVFLQYLTQLEGPLWREIRGLGLAYDYRITLNPASGLMYFYLYKSVQVVQAYKKTVEIVNRYLSGAGSLDATLVESARSSLVFEVIEKEKTVTDAAAQSLVSYLHHVDLSYHRDLLKAIESVSEEDMIRVGRKYVKPLMDVNQSHCSIVCHPSKVESIRKAFSSMHKELTVIKGIEGSYLYDM